MAKLRELARTACGGSDIGKDAEAKGFIAEVDLQLASRILVGDYSCCSSGCRPELLLIVCQ